MPVKRYRRGIIDGLGSAIKFITGNMDAQDAQEINKQIQTLTSNTNNLTNIIQTQHTLNFQLINRLKNITDHINADQEIIKSFLERSENKIRQEDDILEEIQYLNQINFNIDLLSNHLSNIAEAILLSRLNIIPKLLLSVTELEKIENHLIKQDLKINSLEQLYELLNMQAYYNNTNIIFNIRIPNLELEKYLLYHIIPLPINNTKLIRTKPFVNYNKKNIQYLNAPCPKIESTYFCFNPKTKPSTADSNCIGQLLENRPAHCLLEDVGRIESISQPEPNCILFINAPTTQIKSTCSIKETSLQGTGLIRFKNCNVEINGITYEDDHEIFWDEIHVPPLPPNKIQTNITLEILNLQKLKEYNFETETKLQAFRIETKVRNHLTLASITILVLATSLIAVLIYRNSTKSETPPTLQSFAPAPMTSLWPSLYFRGGRSYSTRCNNTNNNNTTNPH